MTACCHPGQGMDGIQVHGRSLLYKLTWVPRSSRGMTMFDLCDYYFLVNINAMHKKEFGISLFVFRRDLNINNTALTEALRASETVIPAFIFDPRQIKNNPYKSNASIQFMMESLLDLEKQLHAKNGKLFYFTGHAENTILRIIQQKKIDAVFLNYDYTPFSRRRDQLISDICKKNNVAIRGFHDALLHIPQSTLKKDGNPYKVFTRFYEAAKKLHVGKPFTNRSENYYQGIIPFAINNMQNILNMPNNSKIAVKGGTNQGRKLIKKISKKNYTKYHDFPAKDATTHLSAHLKFNTVPIREIYYSIKNLRNSKELLRQLYWRDFFTLIGYYFPHVLGHAFDPKLNFIPWYNDKTWFSRWCYGETGFPIVDAGMRQLNTTHFMHNRARLITASFLTKDLLIDWRWGEKYFAQKLVDYDPLVNNGNWQWVAGTGCDAQPYFRVFNPWLQQIKFDPDCEYIKTYIPELKHVPNKAIHNWDDPKYHHLSTYPAPIVNHAVQAKKARKIYGE